MLLVHAALLRLFFVASGFSKYVVCSTSRLSDCHTNAVKVLRDCHIVSKASSVVLPEGRKQLQTLYVVLPEGRKQVQTLYEGLPEGRERV